MSDPRQPRLAQIAAIRFRLDGVVEDSFVSTVFPDGWEMPEEMTEVHGLTTEHCLAFGTPMHEVARRLGGIGDGCSATVAHNSWFDRTMMRIEARRHGCADPFSKLESICTMQLAAGVLQLPGWPGKPKYPSLEEACLALLGRPPSGPHSASHDAHDCMEIFLALLTRGAAAA